jgi:type III pantothenate kinase
MLLAIEQGNTNTLFAVHAGEGWRAQWRTATESTRTADEYAVWLYQLLQMNGLDFNQIEDCIISSVVPQSLFNLRKLAQRYFNKTPYVIGDNTHIGIEVRIDKPSEAGADRLVNTVGAWIKYGGPLIVIDSGTATTFEVVAADGALEGTAIAPGINLSVQALHSAAAKLPRIAIEVPRTHNVVGRNTEDQMLIGVFWGYVAMMEGLIARIRAEIGRPAKVIATGGLAVLFDEATDIFDAVDPDLTLEGLAILAERAD